VISCIDPTSPKACMLAHVKQLSETNDTLILQVFLKWDTPASHFSEPVNFLLNHKQYEDLL